MVVLLVIVAVMATLLDPHADRFFPAEDQGGSLHAITLARRRHASRSCEVAKQVEHFYLVDEKDNVHTIFVVAGSASPVRVRTPARLREPHRLDKRPGEVNSAQAIVGRAFKTFSQFATHRFSAAAAPVRELGNSTGFEMELEDRADLGTRH
jgi:multidrug efflux pump